MSANPTGRVEIWTDGACSGNPGPGGWGAVLKYGDTLKEAAGGDAATTNNRMELMAAISALESLKRPCQIDLYTDSSYVRGGIMQWLKGWKKNGWKTATRNRSRTSSFGSDWKRRRSATRSSGIGSKAMPAIR